MDTVNLTVKFEVHSFTRSSDNRVYLKTLRSPWLRPRYFFSKSFNGYFVRMDLMNVPAKFEARSWYNSEYLKTLCSPWIRRSKSPKVTDFGTNRKRVYDFYTVIVTLVLSCTVSEILQVFCAPEWPHPYSAPILGVFPLHQLRWPMLGSARAEGLSYWAVKLVSKNSNLCDHGT